MHSINLSMPLIDLEGNTAVEGGANILLSKILANTLASGESSEPVKSLDWALALHKTGSITVDSTDLKKIEERIKAARLTDLVKGSLLKAIDIQK